MGEATGTPHRQRGALAHLLLAITESMEAVRTGEATDVATTAMALRTCSTVKMMLGPMVAQAQGLAPPATSTRSQGLRTVQDLKVLANDLADAS